ncbi:putative endonuclease [uncultured Mediterranean phage uvMED]|nr:putative endonuclease [uncultured Mediterranean phage uvMED]
MASYIDNRGGYRGYKFDLDKGIFASPTYTGNTRIPLQNNATMSLGIGNNRGTGRSYLDNVYGLSTNPNIQANPPSVYRTKNAIERGLFDNRFSALPKQQAGYSSLGQQQNAMGLIPKPANQPVKLSSDRQPGIPTANNRTAKPNMMNSLLNYASSPSGRGMARGILEASGYSTMPKSLGEVIAKGMEYSQQNVNTDLANQLAQRELDIKEKEAEAVAGGTSKDTASIKNFKFYESLNKEEKNIWDKLENQSPELAYLMALNKEKGTQGITNPDIGTLTPADIKFDETATGILADFVLKEYPQQLSNVQKIDDVIEIMENQEVTGAVEGGTPYALKVILNPESIGVQDDIRSIIFQSLRATLGAQFTEREGENLVRATFNQYLSEEINIKRLKRLRKETVLGLDTKIAMYDHLKEFGTLKNWTGEDLLNPKEYQNNKNNIQQSLFAIEDYEGLDGDKLLEIFKSDISKEEKEFIENNIDLLNETYNLGLEE